MSLDTVLFLAVAFGFQFIFEVFSMTMAIIMWLFPPVLAPLSAICMYVCYLCRFFAMRSLKKVARPPAMGECVRSDIPSHQDSLFHACMYVCAVLMTASGASRWLVMGKRTIILWLS